jgi:mannose-6-phosphate isomerase-like protein (cupin superfamily)
VKIVAFETAQAITRFDSRGATIGGVARCSGHVGVSFIELDPGGVLGMHETDVPQLFLVVEGAGRVRSGDDDPVPVAQGQGAYWEAGELHETVTDTGLTAIIVEADELTLL